MKIESQRLGTVEIDDQSILSIPAGLVGMPFRRRFVLMEFGSGIPLGWLQDVDDGEFGVPVADPGIFHSDYRIEIQRAQVAELGIERVEDAVILVVTTVSSGGVLVTGNLRAPLVVNSANRMGCQVVLDRPDLDLRALVDPVAFAQARQAEGVTPGTTEELTPQEAAPSGS